MAIHVAFRYCRLTEFLFSSSFPLTLASHPLTTYQNPQKDIIFVTTGIEEAALKSMVPGMISINYNKWERFLNKRQQWDR
jgi:hypothetical protein